MMTMINAYPKSPIAILGAGAWGTALALHLSRCGQTVRLWSISVEEIAALSRDRSNQRYLPGYVLPNNIQCTHHLETAIKDCDDVLIAVPSAGYRNVLTQLKSKITSQTRCISATKGMDAESNQFLDHLIRTILSEEQTFAVLSGPSFAHEVAKGLPATLVIASHQESNMPYWIERFHSPLFRIIPSNDVIGVEISGVVKNVIAIATGITDGHGLGSNARSALITQGLAEMRALGVAMGAQAETFVSVAGIGDLMLTCTDNQSRNRRFGLALGEGQSIDQAVQSIGGHVIEGKQNATCMNALAKKLNIDAPICHTICQCLEKEISLKETITQLFS